MSVFGGELNGRMLDCYRLIEIDHELAIIHADMYKLMVERAALIDLCIAIGPRQPMIQKNGDGSRAIRYDDASFVQYPPKKHTLAPSVQPTKCPTTAPTQFPTTIPTQNPTISPTMEPTQKPTQSPTILWDHPKIKSPQKQNKQKFDSAKLLSSYSARFPDIVEIYELPPINSEKHRFSADNQEDREFETFTQNRIDTKKYDLIIAKFDNFDKEDSDINIRSYYDPIDRFYDEVHANYMILLIEGAAIPNLKRIGDLIDRVTTHCWKELSQTIDFPKSKNVTNAVMKATVRCKSGFGYAANMLAIEYCEKLFWCIHECKIDPIKDQMQSEVLDEIRGRIQRIFNSSAKHMIAMHQNGTL